MVRSLAMPVTKLTHGPAAPSTRWLIRISLGARVLFDLDARLLDDLVPAHAFSLEDFREFAGRPADGLEAVARQELLEVLALQDLVDFAVESRDDVRGKPLRPDEAVPVDDFVVRVAGLGDRGELGSRRDALRRGYRQPAQLPGLDVRQRRRHRAEDELHLAADGVLQRRTRAFVRHVQHLDLG